MFAVANTNVTQRILQPRVITMTCTSVVSGSRKTERIPKQVTMIIIIVIAGACIDERVGRTEMRVTQALVQATCNELLVVCLVRLFELLPERFLRQ